MENDSGSAGPQDEALAAVLLSVWQQVMVDNKSEVLLNEHVYCVSKTRSKRLRQVHFYVGGRELLGVEQNPRTTSRWAQMARHGARIMQFMEGDRYLANVADGKVFFY